jgi:septal ring factor EnvC (AmiA/AmiB activator)
MSKYSSGLLTLALCSLFAVGGCQDKKVVQENEQLKAHVAELQQELGDMGNRVDEATKTNEDLMKEVAAVTAENARLKRNRAASQKRTHEHKRRQRSA